MWNAECGMRNEGRHVALASAGDKKLKNQPFVELRAPTQNVLLTKEESKGILRCDERPLPWNTIPFDASRVSMTH